MRKRIFLVVAAFAALTLAGCAGLPFFVTEGNPPSVSFSNDTQDTIAVFIDDKQVGVVGPFVGPTKPEEIGIDGRGPMTSLPDLQVTPSVVSVRTSSGVHVLSAKVTAGPGLAIGRSWKWPPHRFSGGEGFMGSLQIPTDQRQPGEYFDNKMR